MHARSASCLAPHAVGLRIRIFAESVAAMCRASGIMKASAESPSFLGNNWRRMRVNACALNPSDVGRPWGDSVKPSLSPLTECVLVFDGHPKT
jgi:hypothetical protein